MNILHMKYAAEVARLGSLNKAAETLMIAQPNISRSIKELEADLGITIFQRSAKGMSLLSESKSESLYHLQTAPLKTYVLNYVLTFIIGKFRSRREQKNRTPKSAKKSANTKKNRESYDS